MRDDHGVDITVHEVEGKKPSVSIQVPEIDATYLAFVALGSLSDEPQRVVGHFAESNVTFSQPQ